MTARGRLALAWLGNIQDSKSERVLPVILKRVRSIDCLTPCRTEVTGRALSAL